MKYLLTLLIILLPFTTSSIETTTTIEYIPTYEFTMEVVTVEAKLLPNLDTLANYILTQSKTDSTDINAMVQVMLNRFDNSDFKYFSTMLYSKTSLGSGSVKRGGGRYWFSKKGQKYLPMVQREIRKVLDGNIYEDMSKAFYFSNHACKYHTNNSAYTQVYQTKKHKYFKKTV